jgi:hypothetical protein
MKHVFFSNYVMTSPKMEWDSWEMPRQTKLAKASCFLLQIEGEGRHVYVDTTDVKTQALNIQTLSKFISLTGNSFGGYCSGSKILHGCTCGWRFVDRGSIPSLLDSSYWTCKFDVNSEASTAQ